MKVCPTCNIEKDSSCFGKNKSKKDGLQTQCKECRIVSNNKYYKNTPERNMQRQAFTRKRVNENQAWTVKYLAEHPCVDCGLADLRVLEFDHVRGVKLFNIGESFWKNPDDFQNEVYKCDVRCANCHRIVTQERRGIYYRDSMPR